MKKTLAIVGGIVLVCLLIIVQQFTAQHSGMEDERDWFVRSVRYEFAARVDSIAMLNPNAGKLFCRVTSGNPQTHREDSLKQLFKGHDMLYLIFKHSGDAIVFVFPNSSRITKGDCVLVSSTENKVTFLRNRKEVVHDQLTKTLTGFSRPFFLKNK